MLTRKKQAFIEERAKDPLASNAEIARRAGYKGNVKQIAYKLTKSPDVMNRIQELGEIGLNTLQEVAQNGKVEIARVQAGKVLVETAYGKPKDNPSQKFGDITINVNKVSELDKIDLPMLTGSSVV